MVVIIGALSSQAGYLESIKDLLPTIVLLNAYIESIAESTDLELGGYTPGITESLTLVLF